MDGQLFSELDGRVTRHTKTNAMSPAAGLYGNLYSVNVCRSARVVVSDTNSSTAPRPLRRLDASSLLVVFSFELAGQQDNVCAERGLVPPL